MKTALKINIDQFAIQYALALKGELGHDEEDDLLDLAYSGMNSNEIDPMSRELFHSAFFVISRKNKRFIDISKMKKMMKSGELDRPIS